MGWRLCLVVEYRSWYRTIQPLALTHPSILYCQPSPSLLYRQPNPCPQLQSTLAYYIASPKPSPKPSPNPSHSLLSLAQPQPTLSYYILLALNLALAQMWGSQSLHPRNQTISYYVIRGLSQKKLTTVSVIVTLRLKPPPPSLASHFQYHFHRKTIA